MEPTEAMWACLHRLLEARPPPATLCPSEVARALAPGEREWRALMPAVRALAGCLADQGLVEVCQQGQVVDIAYARGPVRLRQGPRFPASRP